MRFQIDGRLRRQQVRDRLDLNIRRGLARSRRSGRPFRAAGACWRRGGACGSHERERALIGPRLQTAGHGHWFRRRLILFSRRL